MRQRENVPFLDLDLLRQLGEAVRDAGDHEICGFVLETLTGEREFVRIANWSGEVGGAFVSSSQYGSVQRYAKVTGGKILAFLHSHRSTLDLSDADRESLSRGQLSWVVVRADPLNIEYRIYKPPE